MALKKIKTKTIKAVAVTGGHFVSLVKSVALFIAAVVLRMVTSSGYVGQGVTEFAVNGIAFVFFLGMFYFFMEWTGTLQRLK